MRPRIGFVTCVHPFYDLPAVAAQRTHAVTELERCGCEVLAPEPPRTVEQAIAIAGQLREGEVDLTVLFFCTWVAEDITLAVAQGIAETPLLLWALPFLDRDIPMPSPMSGLVASGSNIRRTGKLFVHLVGAVTPEKVRQVARAARAAAVVQALRRARFGLIGDPCPGMLDVVSDEDALQHVLGTAAVHLDLESLLQNARDASSDEAAAAAQRLIAGTGGLREGSAARLAENLRIYLGMKELIREHRLDAYCIRCWPELRNQQGITACATHALLSQEGIPSTCEVDFPALITTFILSRLAGAPAFNFDITAYLEEEDALQFAHCGAADPALAGNPQKAELRVHMRTGTGATVEFPFREGPVTLAKLLRPSDGRLLLFVARGTVIASGDGIRGSVATVRPEPSAAAFLDRVMRDAVEHHFALVYGDWTLELQKFCEFTGVGRVIV